MYKRQGEFYAAGFDSNRGLLLKPCVATLTDIAGELPQGGLLLGTGAQAILAASRRQDIGLSSAGSLPVAANFVWLAVNLGVVDAVPSPLYLRAPDAKPQSVPLRRATALRFQSAPAAAAELLSSIYAEAFDAAWSADEFASLLATPGSEAVIALEQDEPCLLYTSPSPRD